jgi:hypothetical protein
MHAVPDNLLIPDGQHPDYLAGKIDDIATGYDQYTPVPDGPLPEPRPFPRPLPRPEPFPLPHPLPLPFPWPSSPNLPLPLNFCAAVSGRYRVPSRPIVPHLPMPPIFPPISIIIRVDADRFFPQHRISIEVNRAFPRASAHAIAEITSDACTAFNRRRIQASITYRDGSSALIPGDTVVFEARRTTGFGYGAYTLTFSGAGVPKTHNLEFVSQFFDPVEFEVDRVANSGAIVTAIDTAAHPNRPADLPAETVTLATVYRRAGFDVTLSPNTSVIPIGDTGANGTWSDDEMHNAMITYWSRFSNSPRWALWVLYAARHDLGRGLGGIMFDDIGPNHRQGTAIFTDSFIQDAPNGDANPAAWRQRMMFWTAAHEMGHAFNLAHSWQKALGTPWIPLANEPAARSFMNYPFRVGEAAFFADFRFRFSDTELLFMRHAPRRFVQMGNSDWFVDHNFEAPGPEQSRNWTLAIRPNREINQYAFLEPVNLELKLTNSAAVIQNVESDLLADGKHITIFVARHDGLTRQWQPFATRCHAHHVEALAPGASVYGKHLISASPSGWLIDEPGFYKIQAAIDLGNEIVVSNVLRIFVAPPMAVEEARLAPDYFTEDVGRVLAFHGAPALKTATDTLREIVTRVPDSAAATHARVALSAPLLRDYKVLTAGRARGDLVINSKSAKVEEAGRTLRSALIEAADAAATTLGHIDYFGTLDQLANALRTSGNEKAAADVLKSSIATMKARGVLDTVIAAAQRKLKN